MGRPRSPFPKWWIRDATAQVGLTKVEMADGWTQAGLPAVEGRGGWTRVGLTAGEMGDGTGAGEVARGGNGGGTEGESPAVAGTGPVDGRREHLRRNSGTARRIIFRPSITYAKSRDRQKESPTMARTGVLQDASDVASKRALRLRKHRQEALTDESLCGSAAKKDHRNALRLFQVRQKKIDGIFAEHVGRNITTKSKHT